MSFEGYYQILFKNGHERSYDVYSDVDTDQWSCDALMDETACGAPLGRIKLVDQTNGEGVEWRLKEVSSAVYERCECCGHDRLISEPTYRIRETGLGG